jgi:uncharacterized membrane protein (UPF0127 family)
VLVPRLLRADTWWSRLRGLIGSLPLIPGEALWIEPCSQVHTHFMGYPLHVAFVDRAGRVLRVKHDLGPWRFSPWVRGARSVIEVTGVTPCPIAEGEVVAGRGR